MRSKFIRWHFQKSESSTKAYFTLPSFCYDKNSCSVHFVSCYDLFYKDSKGGLIIEAVI